METTKIEFEGNVVEIPTADLAWFKEVHDVKEVKSKEKSEK